MAFRLRLPWHHRIPASAAAIRHCNGFRRLITRCDMLIAYDIVVATPRTIVIVAAMSLDSSRA